MNYSLRRLIVVVEGVLFSFTATFFVMGQTEIAAGTGANGQTFGVAVGYLANGQYYGAAVGQRANGQNGGSALGPSAIGQYYGAAMGASANGQNKGAAVGFIANGQYYGAAVGQYANGQLGGAALGPSATGQYYGVAVGASANGQNKGAAVGFVANGQYYGAAVGQLANGQNGGSALGPSAIGQYYGAAMGASANGQNEGAAVGFGANGQTFGAAVGKQANGQNYGAAVGFGANGKGANVAVGYGANCQGGINRIAIGRSVVNNVDNSARIRGNLYLDGGSTIYRRSTFGSGSFSVKAFTIDHPLDPDNKVLRHYCLEGPEVWNVYAGNTKLVNGRATVELPAYYSALNKVGSEIYSLTPMGDLALVCVKRKVSENSFLISGDKDVEVSWTIKVQRNDPACLDDLKLRPVEQLKSQLSPDQVSQENAAMNTIAISDPVR